jgi:flagellar hook assembly protein FlgD
MDQGNIADTNVHVIEWDASDENGTRVNNGLYLYKFTADNNFGKVDKVVNIIGVIR